MSYLVWRKENEAKYRDIVNDGALETFPGFKESSTNELSDTVIGPVVDQILADPKMTPLHFICVFAEYLYEEYGVIPADLEILAQYMMQGIMEMTADAAKMSAEMVTQMMMSASHPDSDDDEETSDKL